MVDAEKIKAPTYNELLKSIAELTTKVRALENATATESNRSNTSLQRTNEIQEFRVLPDLDKTVKSFTGCENVWEAGDWLQSVDCISNLNTWPFQFRVQFVRAHVIGAARNWFLGRDFEDWEDFTTQFKATFVRGLRKSDQWEALQKRQQGRTEHLMEYFQDKVRMCRELNLPFEEVRDYVIQGVYSKELAMYTLGRQHVDENGLLVDMRDWLRMSMLRADASKQLYTGRDKPVQTGKIAPQENSTGRNNHLSQRWERADKPKAVEEDTMRNRDPVCGYCKKIGHLTRDCPTKRSPRRCYLCGNDRHLSFDCPNKRGPLKCYGCGEEGHFSRECPSKKATHTTAVRIEPQENPYIKQGKINGQGVSLLLDTGSYYSILKLSVAKRCRLTTVPSMKQLYGIGSTTVPSVQTVGEGYVQIEVDGIEAGPVEVLVVPDHVQGPNLIVGRNWLDLPEISYWKEKNKLVIGKSEDKLQMADTSVMVHGNDNEVIQVLESTAKNQCKELEKGDFKYFNEEVSIEDGQTLLRLVNEYRDCFAMNLDELGCTQLATMELQEVEDSAPVVCKPYKTSNSDREAIAEIVSEWKKQGIVKETDSPYASPVILVRQGDKNRLCVDYRRLNKQLKRHHFPLPDLHEQIESLSRGKYFAQLDLASGYLQIPLTTDAQIKTAFVTSEETGQFTRMPFGLAGAPGEFTKLMHKVLGELRNKVVKNYLDDWVIDASSWSDMLEKLRMVLEKLRSANLTLKPSKCSFGALEIEFLGFVIGGGMIRPGVGKTRAIHEFPCPEDVHAVRRFLGLTGFFRRFVKNYAVIAEPLTRLTKSTITFDWTAEQETAFRTLKTTLESTPVLSMFNPDAIITEVHTDASAVGLGAMLLQSTLADEPRKLVYCISKKLSSTESNYHSSKLELMAVVWAVDRWRYFLLGHKFVIYTDCQALIYLHTNKTTRPQIARWYDILLEFNFEICYRPGKKMLHVDALSRAPVEEDGVTGQAELLDKVLAERLAVCISLSQTERVLMAQTADDELREIVTVLKKPQVERTKREIGIAKDFVWEDNLLYKMVNGRRLFVMPRGMRKSLVVAAHDLNGHQAVDKTISAIKQDYWFVGMRRYVKQHVYMCFECLMIKRPRGKRPGLLHPIPVGRRPFSTVHADHMGPFITSNKMNKYIFVIVDNLTKYVAIYAVPDTTTEQTLGCVKDFVQRYGLPRTLVTDRGTSFTSNQFETYCQDNGIGHVLTSTRRPQANGQVERINSVILAMLKTQLEEAEDWDEEILKIQRQINSSESKTTHKTPFEMLHGYKPRFSMGKLRELTDLDEEWECPEELWKEARENIQEQQKQVKIAYDKHRHDHIKFSVGEVVVMTRVPTSTGESAKLQDGYRGPLVIVEVLGGDAYRVAQLRQEEGRQFATTAHVSQLKSWKVKAEEDEVEACSEGKEIGDDEVEPRRRDKADMLQPRLQRTNRNRRKPAYLKNYVI